MEIDEARDHVTKDVDDGVGTWLPADNTEGLSFGAAGSLEDAPDGTSLVAVQWVHSGRNLATKGNPFSGLAPTGQVVEIHGITLVEDRGDDEPLFHRYVDWVGVFDQLGLAVSTRLPVPEHPGQIPLDSPPDS